MKTFYGKGWPIVEACCKFWKVKKKTVIAPSSLLIKLCFTSFNMWIVSELPPQL